MSNRDRKLFFFANAVWGDLVGGGDIHFYELARGAAEAGWKVYCFGGPALKQHVLRERLPVEVILTEKTRRPKINEGSLRGQIQMFCDYVERCVRSIGQLGIVGRNDTTYSVTDYWCDSIPMLLSRSRSKAMVFHMEAPTLMEILRKGRPDVEAGRLASFHYWLSQRFSLNALALFRNKHLFLLHPAMRPQALEMGYQPGELSPISYGLDVATAESVPQQARQFDVCWIGRVHRQKGVGDLLEACARLTRIFPDFKAVFMGKVEAGLRPQVEALGLSDRVFFPGFVSEAEKFRLFKSSRLFLMPSRHEGSPRVVGEALACEVPVLAYDLPTYRPVFGAYARYVKPFDLDAFCREAEVLIRASRSGDNYLDSMDLAKFRRENSWEEARRVFLEAIEHRLAQA